MKPTRRKWLQKHDEAAAADATWLGAEHQRELDHICELEPGDTLSNLWSGAIWRGLAERALQGDIDAQRILLREFKYRTKWMYVLARTNGPLKAWIESVHQVQS